MATLLRTDPFRDFDRLTQRFFSGNGTSAVMPMDAYRSGNDYVVRFDLPGFSPEDIDISVEGTVLTVRAERNAELSDGEEVTIRERRSGTFSRQLSLGKTLDPENITARYDAGVLTLRIPFVEKAKPRKIAIGGTDDTRELEA